MQALRRTAAFTLIELLVVLTLVGILTATAVLKLGSTTQAAKLEWAVDQFAAADNLMRTHSLACGQPGHLRLALGKGQIEKAFGKNGDARSVLNLGTNIQLKRFLTGGRQVDAGDAAIDYSPYGSCKTFAVELSTTSRQTVWMLFAGITGQVTRFKEEQDVRQVLQALQVARPDAG